MRKSGESVEWWEKLLCKRIMHNSLRGYCGKPLWRSLWKMWKSSVFPQINRPLPTSGRQRWWIFFCIIRIMRRRFACYVTAKKRQPQETFYRKSWQNQSLCLITLQMDRHTGKKFVENRQIFGCIICRPAEIMEAEKYTPGGSVCPER